MSVRPRIGDTPNAFEEAWAAHAAEIRRTCVAMIGLDAGEEAFASAAVVALRVYPRHAAEVRDIRSWLLRLARNVCIDMLRAQRRELSLHEPEIEAVAASMGLERSRSPEQILLRNELARRIARSLHHLPARYRLTLQLHLDQHSPRAIADLLDISEANVRKRLQVAREMLRRELDDYAAGRAKRLRRPKREPAHARRVFVQLVTPIDRAAPRDLTVFSDQPPRRASERRTERAQQHMVKHPRGWKAILDYARALRDAGAVGEAIRQYERAMLRRPQSAEPLAECAALLIALGDCQEAIRITERALFMLRGSQSGRAELWLAIARGDAVAIVRAAHHDRKLPPSDLAAAGAALLRLQQPGEAAELLERLLATMGDDPTLLILSHDALQAMGESAVATLRFEQAARGNPRHPLLPRRRLTPTGD